MAYGHVNVPGGNFVTADEASNLTVAQAAKLGSTTVGGAAKPIYLSSGTATACSSTVGSATQPVYMNKGTITEGTYTLGKSVPSDAVFTDTTYSAMTGATSSAAGTSGLVPAPAAGSGGKVLRGDGTWGSADTATTATKLGSSTVGGAAKPIYLSSGTATACSSTVGSATQPVYMNEGTITAMTGALSPTYGGTGNTSVDTTPTSGSTKMVTSGGIYTAIDDVKTKAEAAYETACAAQIAVEEAQDMLKSMGYYPSSTLADNEPATIKAAASAGLAADYWSVGDKIGIALSGTVGALTLNSTYYAFIIGFGHNSSIEGANTIHFQFGKTSAGVNIAFVDGNYYGDTTSTASSGFVMNTSGTNSGGWSSSYMRNTICAAFLKAMPTAWQSVISGCYKYSDNTGNASDTASYVTRTTDSIFLLSEYEVQGTRSYANSAEQNYQAQYDYYANGNSKIKYKHSATSTACFWWLRSVYATAGNVFCGVSAAGSASNGPANFSWGFAPGFMVA